MTADPTHVTVADEEILERYVRKLDSTVYPKRRPHHPRVVASYKDDIAKADAQIKANSEFATSPYAQPPSGFSWWNPFSWAQDSNPTPQSQVKVSPKPHHGQSQPSHTPHHSVNGSKSLNAESRGGSGGNPKGGKSVGKGGKAGKVVKNLTQTKPHTSGLTNFLSLYADH